MHHCNANLSQSISQHSSQKTFPLTRHCTEKDTVLVFKFLFGSKPNNLFENK